MIKRLVEEFDFTQYTDTDISKLQDGMLVKLNGTITINKKNGNSGEYFSMVLSRRDSKVGANIFNDHPLFQTLAVLPGCVEGIFYGKIYRNGKFVNVDLANMEYYVEDSVDLAEMDPATSQIYQELLVHADAIDDPFLRNVVLSIYNNKRIMKKFLSAPASEFSAYSWLGGLAQMTREISNLTCTIADAKNSAGQINLKLNTDMIKAAALLCNIGRAYMYDIQSDGKFLKNDYAVLDSDTSLTRDAVKKAIADTLAIEDIENNKLYVPKHGDVIKELIHILDTSKSMMSVGVGASAPRTRNAAIFAMIVSMINSAGTFDKLENANIGNEKIVKAFDGGKCYFLPAEY